MRPIRPFAALVSVTAALVLVATPSIGATRIPDSVRNPNSDGRTAEAIDTTTVLVEFSRAPLSTSASSRPAQGRHIDFESAAVRAERARLAADHDAFRAWVHQHAPAARITSSYDIALNAVAVELNGESPTAISRAPGVRAVRYQAVYYPLDDNDPDLSIIHAQEAWDQSGGPADAGRGVKVAIVDTGIDVTHPCFDDAGYPAQTQLGDTNFTNNKVIAAKVFNNKTEQQGFTPEAVQDHGTHVAGTVACNLDTPATVSGVDIPYGVSGVAPAALLGNYNVFPGDVGNARSEDILNALETAYADGFDVANLSLGGGSHGFDDLLAGAIDDLDRANMVVAVAAGNSGPGHFTIESPGKAARALTAGASTVPHFVGAPLSFDSTTLGLASGDFAVVESDLTAPLGVVPGSVGGLDTACAALPAGSLAGEIAVVSRGTCTFSTKIRNAQSAGAIAAVVVNNVAGDPTAMAGDGTPDQPTIPAYMAGLSARPALAAADGSTGTIGAGLSYFSTTSVDIMAGFSSQGPTDVDFRIKPDVVAPGVNVLSSVPAHACEAPPCWAFFQGTSMATPHLAGSAAVIRGAHPTWTAAQIRSAIVNTADQGVLTDSSTGTTVVTDVNIAGAGRENLLSAVTAVTALDPVSTSFGAVTSRSGQTRTATVTVTNLSSQALTLSFAVDALSGTGATLSVGPAVAVLAPGDSTVVTLTLTSTKGASKGDHQSILRVSSAGTEVAHAAVYMLVK